MTELERNVLMRIKAHRLPDPEHEHRFHEPDPGEKRKGWRFDFAWPTHKIAIECEGGVYVGGRHTRGAGFEKDCAKYNAAALQGWMVYRVTSGMVSRGEATSLLREIGARLRDAS